MMDNLIFEVKDDVYGDDGFYGIPMIHLVARKHICRICGHLLSGSCWASDFSISKAHLKEKHPEFVSYCVIMGIDYFRCALIGDIQELINGGNNFIINRVVK